MTTLDEGRIALYGIAWMLRQDGVPDSTVGRLSLATRLDEIRPSTPFDLEPLDALDPFSGIIANNTARTELKRRYDDCRLWHKLREMIDG